MSSTSSPSPEHLHQSQDQMNRRRTSSELGRCVVAIKAISSSAKAEDLREDKLLSADVVEQVSVGGVDLRAPFAGGKTGLQRELRRLYSAGQTSLQIKVKRGGGKIATVKASIVPDDSTVLKKQYVLRAPEDANHVVAFTDSTEEECLALQEMRCARLVSHLANTQLTDLYVPYPWEEKMKQLQSPASSSMVFSMLVVPHAPDSSMPLYKNVEDTVARAMAWLAAAQASGVPIVFLNVQTEPLLTKVSGQQDSSRTVSASSRDDLASIVNVGIYGFEDYHGIDIGVVRAVRVWYVPNYAEIDVVLKADVNEGRLGVGISRTAEGFCYVSSVEPGTVADRAGLRELLRSARHASKLIVIARLGNEKITPWLVASSGAIRCFDTTSLSHKLSVHRQAGLPIHLHLMAWDEALLPCVTSDATTLPTSSSSESELSVRGVRSNDDSSIGGHIEFTFDTSNSVGSGPSTLSSS